MLCLKGSIGLVTKLLMEVCCCGLFGLTASWLVVGADGMPDAADAVSVPPEAVDGLSEEVLVVETDPAAVEPTSSLSVLTCANSTVGCEDLRCLLKFEVLPPLVENIFLHALHFALVAEVATK